MKKYDLREAIGVAMEKHVDWCTGVKNTASAARPLVYRLTREELIMLRRDMAESSAWAKAELKRRRAAKNQKKSGHGIGVGIEKHDISK